MPFLPKKIKPAKIKKGRDQLSGQSPEGAGESKHSKANDLFHVVCCKIWNNNCWTLYYKLIHT